MHNKKSFLFILVLVLFSQLAFNQNNTNSPYTRYGYGEINDNHNGEQRAMGGIALGVRSPLSINSVNPASYSAVDSMTFMFDFGASALRSQFKDNNGKSSSFTANLDYITMQFPFSKTVGFSAGIQPYSFSGYNFYTTEDLTFSNNSGTSDTVEVTKSFTGSGGFSEVYAGLSVELFHHLALGANAYYMFGSLNNYRSISFNPSTGYTSTTQLNNIEANNFRFRYGLQYFTNLNKKQNITVGLIFEPKKNFKVNCTKINSGVLTDTTTYDMDFDLPMTLGGGIFYTYNNKLSVGLDYTLQNWSDARFYGKTDSLTNRNKIAIGAEYIPNSSGRKYSDHIRYRIGFNVNNAYYKIDNKTQGNNFGVTLGFGLPLPYSKTMVNTAFEYGKIGNSGSLKENYFKFTFNVCVNENWFFKRKL
jgi:hypothetical protein